MMKKISFFLVSLLICSLGYSQANADCSGAAPFCSDLQYSFPMNTNAGSAEIGPDYGCLGSEPNPAWYFMQIENAGDINIYIESQQGEDVDFICYGPFATLTGVCSNLTAANTVDCSYSGSATENCYIPNGQPGEFYLLLLTNFSNQTSTVNFSQTSGSGSTDCSILNVDAGNNGPLCTGDTLILNVDTITGATYSWSGPLGFTSNLPSPVILNVTTANAGIYTCIVVDTNAVSDTVITSVIINPTPVASLVVANPYCLGDPINLDASGTVPLVNITTFYYDLDNNGSYETNTINPIYNASSFFPGAGNFPISLITESVGGCSDTVTAIVELYNKPTIGLSVTDPTVCIYNDADFSALAFIFNASGQSSTISGYEWDFDFDGTADSSGATLTGISHHFPGLGTYPVVVTVTSSVGCERSDTINVIIVDIPQGNILAPQVCGNVAASFSFNNTGLPVTSYNWNFGDPTVTTDVSTNSSPTYMYPGEGIYGITLIAATADGCLDTLTALINVDPLPAGTIPNTSVCQGLDETFTFTQTSTDSIISYNWNFVNGNPIFSNLPSPTSTFNFGGPINVSVIITNQYGCSDTIFNPFMVNPSPIAQFGIYPICISRFTFDPLVTPNDETVVIDWNLGDGTILPGQDTSLFNHVYNTSGNYNVTLIITDQLGCSDTITKPVFVDDSLFIAMPNVLVQSSTMDNDKVDFDKLYSGFNLCVEYTYSIYNRWGVLVFQTHNDPYNPDVYCDACFKGIDNNGTQLSPGVYFYVLQGNYNVVKSGSITIFE